MFTTIVTNDAKTKAIHRACGHWIAVLLSLDNLQIILLFQTLRYQNCAKHSHVDNHPLLNCTGFIRRIRSVRF